MNEWGTWAVESVLMHVFLPDSVGISIGLKEYATGQVLSSALIGRRGTDVEVVRVGPRSYDGTYTEVEVSWKGYRWRVESNARGDDLTILATPLDCPSVGLVPTLVVEAVSLWGRGASVALREGELELGRVRVRAMGSSVEDPYLYTRGPRMALRFYEPVLLTTRSDETLESARDRLSQARAAVTEGWAKYGELSELAEAMHTCLAWDTVYDPRRNDLVSPVSRLWCLGHGGMVLFCWDTFFAAWMALEESPEIAISNAVEILNEVTEAGFVPNYAYATGQRSRDRSQPSVGAMTIREIVERTGRLDVAERTFDALLKWNRWWEEHRAWGDVICPGSNVYAPTHGNFWETEGVGGRFGAALETGLDNSPMYDDIPFDAERELLCMADVGFTALVIADCQALRALALKLGREGEAEELAQREARFAVGLESLWHDSTGMYLNRRTDTGGWEARLSPTHFYPLLTGLVPPDRVHRMVHEHLLNPEEFWGEHVLPSIARNDPAFGDQFYWRGRIWAPMNFLVYLGLRKTDPDAARLVAQKSAQLLLQEWREERHIHENYHADTGDGDDVESSDAFYHWGALLALIALMDAGHVPVAL